MKKVLWVTSTYPLHDKDVEVPWMVAQIEKLKPYYEIEVLAPRYKGEGEDLIHGTKVHRWGYAPSRFEDLTYKEGMPTKIKNPLRWPWFLSYCLFGHLKMKELFKKTKYDAVLVNWPLPHTLMVPKHHNIISKVYTAELVYNLPGAFEEIHKKSKKLIFISSYAQEKYERIIGEAVDNGEVSPELPMLSAAVPVPHDEFNVLYVGRLVERKGVTYLIDAAKKMKDCVFHIVGNGPEKGSLIKQADGYDNIIFHGKIPDENLLELYSIADVFVLPAIVDSRGDTEGLGVVLIEAMRSGVPCIASNVGGIRDIIQHEKTGLLVNQKNSEEIVDAIKRIRYDDSLKEELVTTAHAYLSVYFSWETVVRRMRGAIDGVI